MTPDTARQSETLQKLVDVYCRRKHGMAHGAAYGVEHLCAECRDLLAYAQGRLEKCPHDLKPACKACDTPCYAPAYRQRMRAVMQSSGMYFILHGRLDWLAKYFLGRRRKRTTGGPRRHASDTEVVHR